MSVNNRGHKNRNLCASGVKYPGHKADYQYKTFFFFFSEIL